MALINLIAVGLPNFVRNRIDKEKLKTVENLLNEIRSLEYLVKNVERKTITNQEKNPKINLIATNHVRFAKREIKIIDFTQKLYAGIKLTNKKRKSKSNT